MSHGLHPTSGDLFFPSSNYYSHGMNITPSQNVNLLQQGTDPKPLVLEYCKPQCIYWKEKLERCESKLATIIKINPTKTCLYPMRDYVTCVEAWAQPKIHNQLRGTERGYQIWGKCCLFHFSLFNAWINFSLCRKYN